MLALMLVVSLVGAQQATVDSVTGAPDVYESSVTAFVDRLAGALQARAIEEHFSGAVQLSVSAGRGIDRQKLDRVMAARLKKRLHASTVLVPSNDATLKCRIAVSEGGGVVWAVAVLEGGTLLTSTTVAVSHALDRELEVALGASAKSQQAHFVVERLGSVASGVLDVALMDIDGDTIDELAVLSVDGVRWYRTAAGAHLDRPVQFVALPHDRRWPRVATGWLAPLADERVWLVTSAGHSLEVDARSGAVRAGATDVVPLRSAPGPSGPLCARLRTGSPVVSLPLLTLARRTQRSNISAARIRDLAAVPGEKDAWVYVDDAGALMGQFGEDAPIALAPERVGDRIAIADLDGDRVMDVVTTAATPPGEADQVVVRRFDDALTSSSVLFKSALSGGAIVALAVGHVDYLDSAEVILVEENDNDTVVWRLRHAR